MPRPHQQFELSARDRDVLKDVIYTHIVLGEPVSSRTVSRNERHGLSSASLRNIMADLEDLGYLHQPHTSAGRVPTVAGYHFYIDSLMRQRKVSAKDREYIRVQLDEVQDADDRVATVSHLLSELSQQVGVVLVPTLDETILQTVEFVPLSDRKVLCVVVSNSGFVDNKIVELEEVVSREDLVRASNYLNENFAGKSMRDIRDDLVARMDDDRAQVDQLLRLTIRLAKVTLAGEGEPEIVLDGATGLLAMPELADLALARRLFDTFNDKARLVGLLNRCFDGSGVRVWIGEDSELTSELNLSLVATTYGVGDRSLGSLGIVGPSRMAYDTVIPLVEYLAESLSEALETTFDR